MAQIKVGKKILSEEEHDQYINDAVGGFLFLVGALIAGYFLNSIIPDDWSKYIRFSLVLFPALLVGYVLNYFAPIIRSIAVIAFVALLISGVAYWVWTIV